MQEIVVYFENEHFDLITSKTGFFGTPISATIAKNPFPTAVDIVARETVTCVTGGTSTVKRRTRRNATTANAPSGMPNASACTKLRTRRISRCATRFSSARSANSLSV